MESIFLNLFVIILLAIRIVRKSINTCLAATYSGFFVFCFKVLFFKSRKLNWYNNNTELVVINSFNKAT